MDDLIRSESIFYKELPPVVKEYKAEEVSSPDRLKVITEGAIYDAISENINKSKKGDKINIGIFYLSEFRLLKDLEAAANRGVDVKIVADLNKDAFGLEKNGAPNRPALSELKEKAPSAQIRWYNTQGEQYHTKMIYFDLKDEKPLAILGSGNFTRRNLDNYNLETDVAVEMERNSPMHRAVEDYFRRIWTNEDGEYTLPFKEYKDERVLIRPLWKFQEGHGPLHLVKVLKKNRRRGLSPVFEWKKFVFLLFRYGNGAVAALFRAADVDFSIAVVEHVLAPAHVQIVGRANHPVAAADPFFHGIRVVVLFHDEILFSRPHNARRVESRLWISAVAQELKEGLHVALGLHKAAHDPEGAVGLALFRQKAGNNRVVGPFAPGQTIVVAFFECKIQEAIIQRNPRLRHHDARPEAVVIGLNHGHHVAILIARAEIDRGAIQGIAVAHGFRLLADGVAAFFKVIGI